MAVRKEEHLHEIITNSHLKLLAEKSLYEFFKQAWIHIEGSGTPFIDGWHVGALCEHVQAVLEGEISELLINISPRSCKTSIVSVAAIPWMWTREPSLKAVYASYKRDLSLEHSRICRMLIESYWYQINWGHKFSLLKDQSAKSHFTNTETGHRISCSTSLNAGTTGFGGDLLVLDDPNRAGESAVTRESTNKFVATVWSNRLNPGGLRGKILVQQRTDEEDVSGIALQKEKGVTALVIPMEYEKSRHCKTVILPSTKGKIWEDPRKKDGELMWPQGMCKEELEVIKKDVGQYNYACQFQQRPSPEEGGILKKKWFRVWKEKTPPTVKFVLQCWDTALSAKEEGSFSACTTWGIFHDNEGVPCIILLSLWMGKVEYVELRSMALRLYTDYRDTGDVDIVPDKNHAPNLVLVEAKSSGHQILADLRRAGIPFSGFLPDKYGDKLSRTRAITPLLQNGRVWVPAKPPDYILLRNFAEKFVTICGTFPDKSSLDVVDTFTMCLIYLQNNAYLHNPGEEIIKNRIGPRRPLYGPGT